MKLMRVQKNAIFDLIVNEGLSPAQFDFKELTRKGVTQYTLVPRGSHFYFRFKFASTPPELPFYLMGRSPRMLVDTLNYHGNWKSLVSDMSNWLKVVKLEIEEPDKWAELYKSAKHIRLETDEEENTQFTYQEVLDIQGATERVKAKVAGLEFSVEQLTLINARLDYIANKAKSLGRVDWKNLFIGAMVTVVIEMALAPEEAQALWSIFKEVFQGIILISLR